MVANKKNMNKYTDQTNPFSVNLYTEGDSIFLYACVFFIYSFLSKEICSDMTYICLLG